MATAGNQRGKEKSSTSPLARYLYPPIRDDAHIRLARLFPLTEADGPRENRKAVSSPVVIEMVQAPLTEAPRYQAVSYTWGTSAEPMQLSVRDEGFIPVSKTAFDILQSLRPEVGHEPSYCWMDQICINQQDDGERWQQIRIMRKIYEKAHCTLVVLAGNENYDEILDALRDLSFAPLLSMRGPFIADESDDEREFAILRAITLADIPPQVLNMFQSEKYGQILTSLFNNPVFTRAWVYQEVISSKQVWLLGATKILDWDEFARAFEVAVRIEAAAGKGQVSYTKLTGLELMINGRIIRQAGGHIDWMRLHVEAQGLLRATDHRDNTIALTTFQEFYNDIPQMYRVLDVAFLFKHAAYLMVRGSKTLDFFAALSGAWHSLERDMEAMPSWVPDWSAARETIPFYWPASETQFDAANGYSFDLRQEHSDLFSGSGAAALIARGKKIDMLSCYLENPFEKHRLQYNVEETLKFQRHCRLWTDYAATMGHPLIDGEENFETFRPVCRAMIAAMTAGFSGSSYFTNENFSAPANEEIIDILYDELVFMIAVHDEIMAGEDVHYEQSWEKGSFILGQYGSYKEGMQKLAQWTAICCGRRIAFGETQGMGLVPRFAKPGDLVCIFHGSKVPVVLRRLGRTYRVIGQCYWNGWMYGEKVDWEEDEADEFGLV